MNLADVMDEIAGALSGLGVNVYAYDADRVEPPAALVQFPESIDYDQSYGRGADRMTLDLALVVGRVSDESVRDQLGAYADGSGGKSVKAAVEAATYTACDSVRVQRVIFDVWRITGVDYWAALFTLDIIGSGSS